MHTTEFNKNFQRILIRILNKTRFTRLTLTINNTSNNKEKSEIYLG